MALNVHPIFVHFPIAFLSLYVALEFLSLTRLRKMTHWFGMKASLLYIGFFSALVTLQTGNMAAEDFAKSTGAERTLLHTHEQLAQNATFFFGILVVAYFLDWFFQSKWASHPRLQPLQPLFRYLKLIPRVIVHTPLIYVLALVAFVGLTMAGALGGAIVYGPNADPVVSYVYHLLIHV